MKQGVIIALFTLNFSMYFGAFLLLTSRDETNGDNWLFVSGIMTIATLIYAIIPSHFFE